MSARTIYLARLIGLYCVVIAVVMMSHKQTTVETMTALIRDGPLLYCMSLIGMVTGLAIILGGNGGSRGALPIVVAIVGWLSFIKGLIFMFLPPVAAVRYFEALHYGQFFYVYTSITLLFGIYLTYASFRARLTNQ